MKKRIYILYTGGTIGMKRSPKGYVPMTGLADLISQKIPIHLSANMPEYVLEELDELIDSTNATPADWQLIGNRIKENYQDYDGFIVLHGTDTLAYTSASLSFMLQGLQKPVIVTGSQIPLSELRNDAQDNLITALILASHYALPEVCLYFNGRLLRGNRATKIKSSGFDAFDSPNHPWLGKVGIHIEVESSSVLPPAKNNENFQLPDYGRHRIAPLRLFPGIDSAFLEHMLKLPIDGLILQSYGVGNAPDRDPKFLKTLESAIKNGTAVVNLSQCTYGRVEPMSYATGSALARTGVANGYDMTLEAALTKMHHLFALELKSDVIARKMETSLCGELSC
ncbi:asparaginase [Motiliproteus sp. MSK22-1]|uniref:asparaginase n=1 Tax=Motiliproteus sp. MSK22-1 TaxID=1897630 RepID=UPI0009781E08|nr:asparaginase [Motiliproteus sp. MSK22-1]OMH25984.1 L-asparaginase 1 [Motiliproteus sp. MSK22-1]